MQHKSLAHTGCAVARSLERVGEWWSILILRDASYGMTRFDEFQKSLSIAPNILTKRLNALVEGGLLERRQYQDRPARFEYVLTDAGRDFRPVLWALLDWGTRHLSPEGPTVQVVNRRTGKVAKLMMVDGDTGEPITTQDFMAAPGPAATPGIRSRFAFVEEKRRDPEAKPRFVTSAEPSA
jgi:DNA-binding HxlR family transcriptional regulator